MIKHNGPNIILAIKATCIPGDMAWTAGGGVMPPACKPMKLVCSPIVPFKQPRVWGEDTYQVEAGVGGPEAEELQEGVGAGAALLLHM